MPSPRHLPRPSGRGSRHGNTLWVFGLHAVVVHPMGADATSEATEDPAFASFFEREHRRLVGALYLLTGDLAEAEDLAQEAMARVFERWERVRAMESPTGYVFRVAYNLNRRRLRRLGLQARKHLATRGAADPTEAAEARSDLMRAMGDLPPPQRAALILVEFVGMTSEEAGRALGIAAGSVRARLSKGRAAIRKQLGDDYE